MICTFGHQANAISFQILENVSGNRLLIPYWDGELCKTFVYVQLDKVIIYAEACQYGHRHFKLFIKISNGQ